MFRLSIFVYRVYWKNINIQSFFWNFTKSVSTVAIFVGMHCLSTTYCMFQIKMLVIFFILLFYSSIESWPDSLDSGFLFFLKLCEISSNELIDLEPSSLEKPCSSIRCKRFLFSLKPILSWIRSLDFQNTSGTANWKTGIPISVCVLCLKTQRLQEGSEIWEIINACHTLLPK